MSVTAVLTVTVYNVEAALVAEKVAELPLQDVNVHAVTGGGAMVTFVVFTVAQSTFSLQFIVTFAKTATPDAPLTGDVDITVGAVTSGLIVIVNVASLPIESSSVIL